MNLFHIVEDTQVIIKSKGVYRQVDVYKRGEIIYAKVGTGYVGLLRLPYTTAPNVSWDEMDDNKYIKPGRLGAPTWQGN